MLLLIAFLAGMLTILTPCVLPVLPVILGGSLSGTDRLRPLIITGTLAVSVFAFSLLLKASTLLIDVPPEFWKSVSGGIIAVFGLTLLFPQQWGMIAVKLGLTRSEHLIQSASKYPGYTGEVLLGLALGPVFASCSPTYALILAVVLPQRLSMGVLALGVYALGLFVPMLAIGYGGRRIFSGFRFFVNSESGFRRGLGVLLIVVGLLVITGYEKKLEIALLNNGLYDFTKIDQKLVESLKSDEKIPNPELVPSDVEGSQIPESVVGTDLLAKRTVNKKEKLVPQKLPLKTQQQQSADEALQKVKALLQYHVPAPEFVDPQNWINSEPLSIKSLRGKVVVIDFWTYSCINCLRTLPALKALHEKYASQGLVIVGVHTPEFAFEHKLENVKKAVAEYDLKHAIFQDNDYKTWNAYRNRYWPAKYVIDKEGFIRYTHFGEGGYEQTEQVIKYLLTEGKSVEGEIDFSLVQRAMEGIETGETYLGLERHVVKGSFEAKSSANFQAVFASPESVPVIATRKAYSYTLPLALSTNEWALSGEWIFDEEKVVSWSEETSIAIHYTAGQANLVMGAQQDPVSVEIWLDGKKEDTITVDAHRLYSLTQHEKVESHIVELKFHGKGVELYAWTFG